MLIMIGVQTTLLHLLLNLGKPFLAALPGKGNTVCAFRCVVGKQMLSVERVIKNVQLALAKKGNIIKMNELVFGGSWFTILWIEFPQWVD